MELSKHLTKTVQITGWTENRAGISIIIVSGCEEDCTHVGIDGWNWWSFNGTENSEERRQIVLKSYLITV